MERISFDDEHCGNSDCKGPHIVLIRFMRTRKQQVIKLHIIGYLSCIRLFLERDGKRKFGQGLKPKRKFPSHSQVLELLSCEMKINQEVVSYYLERKLEEQRKIRNDAVQRLREIDNFYGAILP